jgi:hypothetical protein
MREEGMPLEISEDMRPRRVERERITPRSSSERFANPSNEVMSYLIRALLAFACFLSKLITHQPGILIPPLPVIGMFGALGNIKAHSSNLLRRRRFSAKKLHPAPLSKAVIIIGLKVIGSAIELTYHLIHGQKSLNKYGE